MTSFNNVYRKDKNGSWKTKTDQKKDKLKDIFNDIAILSNIKNEDGEAKIIPHTLILAMENQEKTKLHAYFGKKSSDELLKAFSKLDKDGNGAITLQQFIEGAEHAFSHTNISSNNSIGGAKGKKSYDIHEAEGLKPAPAKSVGGGVQNIPQPPPMTREMLYKSVFNNCDEDNKGYVSVKNLINAMKNKRSDLSKIFGPQRSEKALEKFAMLDSTGDGRITFAEFFTGCELAFTNHVSKYEKKEDDYSQAPAVIVKGKVPVAPPMNRHLLYSSVFKSIDTKGKGKISQRDLTRAMGNRRGSIAMIFGHQNTTHAMNIFSKLDEEDTGAVDYATFAKNCEEAFLVDDEGDENDFVPFPAAAPIGGSAIVPTPPPMTRELLYRSVYDEIDTKKKGAISQLDLVKAVKKGRRGSIAKIFGENAIQDAVQAFQDMDVDKKGEVTWNQFFAKAEEAFVHKPNDRVQAPRRSSLKMRRASKIVSGPKAPPLPKQ